MKKIPTLFVRDPENRKYVLPEVTPGCEWVLEGHGDSTRKYDGTCVMFDGEHWWARREVKPGKEPPEGWVQVDHDKVTNKRTGWEPIARSPFFQAFSVAEHKNLAPGTYELCGPKVNGNPEGFDSHVLIEHADADTVNDCPRTYDDLRMMLTHESWTHEGIVWHHPDGRMAKLKRRDFPKETA